MIQVRVSYRKNVASRCRACMKRNGKQTPLIAIFLWEVPGGYAGFVGAWCLACYELMRDQEKVQACVKLPSINRLTLQNRYCDKPKVVAETDSPGYFVKEKMEQALIEEPVDKR